MKKLFPLFTACVFYANLINAQAAMSPIDANSKVHFVIKNFGIRIGGDFSGLKGTIAFDPEKLGTSLFDVTVDASTVDTDNSSRDGHLKKAEYFDVATYKTIHFKSTKVTRSSVAGRFYVFGNLTIKGVTKPVEFGFSATAKNGGYLFDGDFDINRRDFGVGGSSVSMSDNLTVSLSVFAK
ncbi:MAG TPA: YceI family protein [Ferruginibacter sp.]|jgi:polyisoprenoid-binding protein YceI|nr:YceI family protein [Ferruginibacter sp.]